MLGLAVDVYHVWWDPDLNEQIRRTGKGSACSPFTSATGWCRRRDLLLDRGMMGDGVIDLAASARRSRRSALPATRRSEIFSENNWWKKPMEEVLATCIERHRAVV